MVTEIFLPRLSAGDSYKQVAERIIQLIDHAPSGRANASLPSAKLSTQQDVSIATVMQAYRLLESRSVIEARPQSGYYVRAKSWTQPAEPEMTKPAKPDRTRGSELTMQVMVKPSATPHWSPRSDAPRSRFVSERGAQSHDAASVGRRHPTLANSYDPAPGNSGLRVQIASRVGCRLRVVARRSGHHLRRDRGVEPCLRAVAKPGDTIAIESPTFFGILQIIQSLGMRASRIPTFRATESA
jgi:DNA-binding transcriptional MocR family regulator